MWAGNLYSVDGDADADTNRSIRAVHSAVTSRNIFRIRYGFSGLCTEHNIAPVSPSRSEDMLAATREINPLDFGCRRQGGKVEIRVAWSWCQGGLGVTPAGRDRSWVRRSRDRGLNSEMASLGLGMFMFPERVVRGVGRRVERILLVDILGGSWGGGWLIGSLMGFYIGKSLLTVSSLWVCAWVRVYVRIVWIDG